MYSFVNLKKLENQIKTESKLQINGLGLGEKGFITSTIGRKLLYVAPDFFAATNMKRQLKALGRKVALISDKLPLMFGINENKNPIFREYISALNGIVNGSIDVIIAMPDVLMQKLPSPDIIKSSSLNLAIGKEYSLDEVVASLINLGYNRADAIESEGDFAIRGDILDIFVYGSVLPFRINFFGDEIESIYSLSLGDYRKVKDEQEISLVPNTLLFLNENIVNDACVRITKSLASTKISGDSLISLTETINFQIDNVKNGRNICTSFLAPFVPYFCGSILDYFTDGQIIFDEPKMIVDILNQSYDDFAKTSEDFILAGELLKEHKDFYFAKNEVLNNIDDKNLIAFNRVSVQNKIFLPNEVVTFNTISTQKYYIDWNSFIYEISRFSKNKTTVFISAGSSLTFNKLKGILSSADISFNLANTLDEAKDFEINLSVANIPISAGFYEDGFLIIGSDDLNQVAVSQEETKKVAKPIYQPKVNDYVVHEVHGLGKCISIEKLKLTSSYRDYFVIEYQGGDILYLPTENANMLSAYVGEASPKCNKIGGADFYKVKQKVRTSVKELAFDLIKLYSKREQLKGFKYSQDTYLQKEFEKAFPFSYTEDQVQAINDIKSDMEGSRILDRLVCGDVGFGKTEVALVAAYKAIQDGKQVAIICPTTILSEQHYNTCLTRMKDFMVRIASINRLKTPAEQKVILENLKDGKIDIICGTHRLLSSDVKFKDLGLLILDEEQRFGVEHKEKLKNLKNNIDVITLSATPIPRTLYMSLIGIRDISYLNTPPRDRIPTKTTIIDYSDSLLIDACKKEIERGGQVLIVYNRVETIYDFYGKVSKLLGQDVTIGVAHGQMSAKELEDSIYKVFTRQTQVLISTVLIENGVDLPFANTLIVIDADKLGLSQLYQLRGRIGRSNLSSFAYFTFERNKALSEEAYRRLDALMEFSDMGSGYKIAMRDLEIRGAGDILGARQSGHIEKVGYDLYIKLLKEAVSELKGEEKQELKEVKLDIGINAYLPKEYVAKEENRISTYTKISKIVTQEDYDETLEYLQNVYGQVPLVTKQLCKVAFIKNMCQRLSIKSLVINSFFAKIKVYEEIKGTTLWEKLAENVQNIGICDQINGSIDIKIKDSVDKTQDVVINFLKKCLQ